MKLVRFDTGDGAVRLGVVRGDAVVTLTDIAMDYPSVRSIIEGGLGALAKIRDFVAVSPDTVLLKDGALAGSRSSDRGNIWRSE